MQFGLHGSQVIHVACAVWSPETKAVTIGDYVMVIGSINRSSYGSYYIEPDNFITLSPELQRDVTWWLEVIAAQRTGIDT